MAWGKLAAGLLITLSLPAAGARAQVPAESGQAPGAYVMPSTQMWELPSASGEIYRIFLSIPGTPPPDEGYSVLYVLDGNAMFAGFAETRRIQEGSNPEIGNTIVVGVGYPTDQPYDTRRLYDFTSPLPAKVPPEQKGLAQYRSGGHDRFLDFLIETLRPELAKRHRINLDRQALFGHSLGGLFALHVLYSRPDAFNAIIAASPSQWWNDQEILAEERAFAARLSQGEIAGPPSRIMIVAGGEEERIVNTWDAEALANRLEPLSAYGLRSRFELYPEEGHMTVPSRAVTDTLRFAFAWP